MSVKLVQNHGVFSSSPQATAVGGRALLSSCHLAFYPPLHRWFCCPPPPERSLSASDPSDSFLSTADTYSGTNSE